MSLGQKSFNIKKFKMTGSAAPGDLEDIFAQNSVDVHNLEVQIRELLNSMEVVESIVSQVAFNFLNYYPDKLSY